MRTSQIEVFLAVAETGSIATAAINLDRSRTTISTALAALEDELGVNLFDRSGNQVCLSVIGQAVLTDFRRFNQISRQIHLRCQQHLNGAESILRIARDDSLPEILWLNLLRQLKMRFPHTSVSFYLAPPRELPALVSNQVVDVAYGLMPAPNSEGYQWFRKLADVRMMTVAAPEHALSRVSEVLQDDLMDCTQITLAYINGGQLIADSAETDNFLAFTQYQLMCDAVIAGTGWADLPFPLIAEKLRQNRLKLIRYRNAQWWEAFSSLESEKAQGGAVVNWLAAQLGNYLTRLV